MLVVLAIVACTSPPRDLDMMVWSRAGWDPKQEQADYGECFEHAKKAAYRKYHWRRVAVSREAEKPTPSTSPASILSRLKDIATDERSASLEIAEECMVTQGYKLVRINEVGR